MKEITINAQLRNEYGKKASRLIRKAGNVPAVIYGVERQETKDAQGNVKILPVATPVTVSMKELVKVVYTPNVYIININIDGKTIKAVLKDLQADFVKDTPVHVDFYQITEDKPIVMQIPVKLNGLAEGVKAGGKLVLSVRKLAVKATYDKLPDILNVDVTSLGLGKSLKVSDLSFEGVELVTPKEVVVCGVRMTRAAQKNAATEEAAE
jgi:large subunit ribosomal protein L25